MTSRTPVPARWPGIWPPRRPVRRLDPARILAGYGAPVDAGQLAVCEQLRRLHLTVWYNLYAERLPGLRPRAAELLAEWPRV